MERAHTENFHRENKATGADPSEAKKALRKVMLAKRDALSEAERRIKSLRIADKLEKTVWYREAGRILCYVSFRSEVSTRELLERALLNGKRVYCPRVTGKEMEFYEIRGFSDLDRGAYGILEPKEECPPYAPDLKQDLMLVPGSCFTNAHDRLGYGGGYYDRYLSKNPIKTVGIFFDCQETDVIPWEQYDRRLDRIVTETRIL